MNQLVHRISLFTVLPFGEVLIFFTNHERSSTISNHFVFFSGESFSFLKEKENLKNTVKFKTR